MISVENLTKYYGPYLAVNNISFEVERGSVVGFLGPNGAGKSTTVRIITCYLSATSGTATVDGKNVQTEAFEVRKRIGYLPENTPLYTDLNVVDYLNFMYDMRKTAGSNSRKERIKNVLETCGLNSVAHKDIGELSKGYRQRVGLAQTLVHDPDILILDEPTVGLDPNQIIEIRNLIKELGKRKTIIICSHILPEVEATCNKVLIINEGQIVADGTPSELRTSFEGKGQISLEIKNELDRFVEKISALEGIERIISQEKISDNLMRMNLETMKDSDPREGIFRLCGENGTILLEMKRTETSLEDVFRQLTRKEPTS